MTQSTVLDVTAVADLDTPAFLASAQLREDGSPRFRIQPRPAHPKWERLAELEENGGGVSAEIRIFLDAQLETGDVVVDVAPTFGFVSLGAATAPYGKATVFTLCGHPREILPLELSAQQAGTSIQTFQQQELTHGTLALRIADLLPPDGRVFLHADAKTVAMALEGLAPFVMHGRLIACCLSPSPAVDAAHAETVANLLHDSDFGLHELRDRDGDAELFPVSTLSTMTCTIALAMVAATEPTPEHHIMDPERMIAEIDAGEPTGFSEDNWTAGLLPAEILPAPTVAPSSMGEIDVLSLLNGLDDVEPVGDAEPAVQLAPPSFSLMAPYCRTGYGIVGANLLRECLQIGAPVAYFPIGAVDRALVPTEQLDEALGRQGSFDDAAPSVRISQQFDLATHIGRGPRIGFPIFELDQFQPHERHHLERQDRLMVTCEWARNVLMSNCIDQVPIDIVPLGVDRTIFNENVQSGTTRNVGTVFMSVGKLEQRKGQLELLRAFEAAFSPRDLVRLVVVCHNAFMDDDTMRSTLSPFRASPMASRITLVTRPFATQHELAKLMAATDCGVFPARAEGWNLEALEMMSMGKPVIATNCSAHTAYMTPANARLITIDKYEETVMGGARGNWASWGPSQHEQLVSQLRDVHELRQSGELALNRAGIVTAESHTWAASAQAFLRSIAAA